MAMNSVVSYVFIFLAIIGIVFALVVVNTIVIKQKSDTIRQEAELIKKKMNTDYDVLDVAVVGGKVNITLRNTGVEKLRNESVDVYAEGKRLNKSNVSAPISSKLDIVNPKIWDSYETVDLMITSTINPLVNNTFDVAVGNGRVKKIIFRTETMQGDLYYASIN